MSKTNTVVPRALSTRQAAEYLCLSEIVLRQGRCEGPREGHIPPPPYVRIGRKVIYLIDDLDRYLEAHRIEMAMTSQK